MASGVIPAGGIQKQAPGGFRAPNRGGINFGGNMWRTYSGHFDVDTFGSLNSSGARVLQTRGVRNPRKDAKTTGFTYAWTLPTVPGGSTTAVGSLTGASTQTATFLPDVAGAYVLRVVVTYSGTGKTETINFNYTSA